MDGTTIEAIASARRIDAAPPGPLPPKPEPAGRVTRWYALALILAVALGFGTRAALVLPADFPLNDGGLFLVMVEAVRGSWPGLPETVSYNGSTIPFAYPPLAFFAAAGLAELTGMRALDTLRWLPLVASTAEVAAFALLARTLLSSRAAAATSALLFAAMPGSFVWQIMGGGLTRSFGFLFALLGLAQAVLLLTHGGRRPLLLLAVFAALTALSHLEMAWFLTVGVAAAYLAFSRTRAGLLRVVAAGALALALCAPWWGMVLARYGPSPLLAASQTGSLIAVAPGGGPELPQPVVLALTLMPVVAFASTLVVGDRALGLLGWVGLIAVLNSRSLLWMLALPCALVAGEAAGWAVERRQSAAAAHRARWAAPGRPARPIGALLAVAIMLPVGVWLSAQYSRGLAYLTSPLPQAERAAMHWAAEATPAGSRFVVLTGESWALNRSSEWFPVLAQRVSLATPQGTEWLPDRAFARRVEAHTALQACGYADPACLLRWAEQTRTEFDYVYVAERGATGCCARLRSTLERDPRFREVYAGPGVAIFAALRA